MEVNNMRRFTGIAMVLGLLLLVTTTADSATWNVDKTHSEIGFSIRHLGISKVKGTFGDYDVKIEFDGKTLAGGSASAVIRTASIDTRNEDRDNHLRNADFFNVEKFSEITFSGHGVSEKEGGFVLHGMLTMLGVEKHVEIPFEFIGSADDPWGGTRAGFEGNLKIKREDFNLGWADVKYRPPLIGNEVEITLNLEAIQEK